ncbi:hypothetical protein [Klebsiella quasipneumoniae]|jgi:hypothetical protein|nr:hypothetical protein [Klebsiella sp. K5-1]OUI02302.1 hypothetical protein AZZ69_002331 [Klebsiella pneumoniae]STW71032.1 Uncharacterised protein [Klebsiella pneumoniae]
MISLKPLVADGFRGHQMAFKGTLSGYFRDGENDTEFCTDWKFLTKEEKTEIINFIKEIAEKEFITGKNKESWVDDNHQDIPGADGYRDENYWHYHCGPDWAGGRLKSMTKCLFFNPGGMASQQCIHYYPLENEENEIVIIGYSRNHIPFLLPDDPNNKFFS